MWSSTRVTKEKRELVWMLLLVVLQEQQPLLWGAVALFHSVVVVFLMSSGYHLSWLRLHPTSLVSPVASRLRGEARTGVAIDLGVSLR